jgi:integrase
LATVCKDPRMTNAAGKPAWVLNYRGVDGRRRRERTNACTREEAMALLRRRLTEHTEAQARGLQSLDHLKPVSFESFYREKYLPALEGTLKASTLLRKEMAAAHVLPFAGALPLRGVTAGKIEEYLGKRAMAKRKPSPRELNIERGLISSVLNAAFRHGLVDVNEAARVRPFKEAERDLWLTRQEVRHVLDQAEEWVKPFIVLGVHTGMRRGELCSLGWADVDHSPGWLRVDATKTETVRFVPVNSAAKEILDAQPRRIGREGPIPWVFYNARRKGPFKPDSVYHSFKDAAELAAAQSAKKRGHEEAGRLREATFHTLRHSFASWLIQAGVPIAEVQQYLGHSSDTMTRRYAHLAPAAKERRNALEVLVSSELGVRVAKEVVPKQGAL